MQQAVTPEGTDLMNQRMKILPVFIITIVPLFTTYCQIPDDDELVIQTIIDNIISNTTYDFVDTASGMSFSRVNDKNYTPNVAIRSPYNTWHYWNGVLNIALIDAAEYFRNPAYKQFSERNYEFIFENVSTFEAKYNSTMNKWSFPFGQYIVTRELDDCGAMGGGLIEVYREKKKKEYRAYIDKAADHILNKQERLDDGTLVRSFPHRMTLWADDLYMSIVFLARMGNLTGDRKYFDDAAKQVINFTRYLCDSSSNLYYHCWYSDTRENGVAHWGRGNGWAMLAQAELLQFLPKDHPQRDTLIRILHQHVSGISKVQSASGLWHQLLDKEDSYPEVSCSAMFTFAIAKAINSGWIGKEYLSIAQMGWEGIKSKVQPDGQVADICIGTGIGDDLVFYYHRPTKLNDIHGLGAVILAGIEMLKVSTKYQR